MFIKNFTDRDLLFDDNGSSIVLTANDITLIPDGLTTIANLQKMFGKEAVAVSPTGPSTSILKNQQTVTMGKLYCTAPTTDTYDHIRLFVSSGATISVYGSDSTTIPTALSQMNCPEENTGVGGCLSFACVPRYISFQTVTGTPSVVITNCELFEVSSIS